MMSISNAFGIKQTLKISEEDLNGHIVKLKLKSAEIFAIADSGSPVSFLNDTTARRIHQNDKTTVFKKSRRKIQLEIWHAIREKLYFRKDN